MELHWGFGPWQSYTTESGGTAYMPPIPVGEDVEPTARFNALDLRPSGRGAGMCLFWSALNPVNWVDRGNVEYLGQGSFHDLKVDQRVRDMLGVLTSREDIVGCIAALFGPQCDPLGQAAPRPFVPTNRRRFEICMGPLQHLISFDWSSSTMVSHIRDVLRDNVREKVETMPQTQETLLHIRKYIGYQLRKYGIPKEMWDVIVPLKYRNAIREALDPETTITESFNQADSSTLGPDLTWTEHDVTSAGANLKTVSNQFTHDTNNSDVHARAESDLSGDDHYAQVVSVSFGGTNFRDQLKCLVRIKSANHDSYTAAFRNNNTGLIRRYADPNSFTGLSSSSPTIAAGQTYKLEVNGSTLTQYVNGGSVDSTTDSNYTGQTRCGFGSRYNSTASVGDSFEAADLGAVGPANIWNLASNRDGTVSSPTVHEIAPSL